MSYLTFDGPHEIIDKKTKEWYVKSQGDVWLGTIRFFNHWRKYIFQPSKLDGAVTLFDSKCLTEIAEFLDDINIQEIHKRMRLKDSKE